MGHVNATFDSLFSAWKQCAIKSRFENTTQIRFKKNGQENPDPSCVCPMDLRLLAAGSRGRGRKLKS